MSMNITGMASGIDVNNIIEELMQIARRPVVRNEALIEINEEKQGLWRETNVRMAALQRSLGGLINESVFTAKQANSSNSDVASASVTGTPVNGTYNLEVHQLAAHHAVAMGSGVSNPNAVLNKQGVFYLDTGATAQSMDIAYRQGDGAITEKRINEDGLYRYREGNAFKIEADVFKQGLSSPPESSVIMGSWDDDPLNPPAQWSLYETHAGELVFQYRDADGGIHEWETFNTGILQSGNWSNVSVEFTFGETESFNMYLDGERLAGDWQVGDGSKAPSSGGGPMYIGSQEGLEQEWQGLIGEVNLYKNNNIIGNWPSTTASYELVLDDGGVDRLTGNLSAGYHAHVNHDEDDDGVIDNTSFPLTFNPQNFNEDDVINIYLDGFTSEDGTNIIDELRNYHGHGVNDHQAIYDGTDPYITIAFNGGQWEVKSGFDNSDYEIHNNHVLGNFSFRQEVLTEIGGMPPLVSYAEQSFDLKVSDEPDPRKIEVRNGDSLNDIADKINAADIDVNASVVMVAAGDYRLVLTSAVGGVNGEIHAWDGDGTHNILEDVLNLISSNNVIGTDFVYETQEAKDPRLSMNGIAISRTSNVIDDLIDGVTLELKSLGRTTVEVSQSVEDAQVSVAEFVEAYNETLAWVRALMDKDDGPLHGDTTMIRLERQLRSIVTGMVSDIRINDDDGNPLYTSELKYKSLSAIGIMSFDEQGILQIDSAKLRNALLDDPDGVYKLFARKVDLDVGETFRSGPEGIARQLQEFTERVTARSRGVITERLNYLNRRIDYLQMNNERLERRLEAEEKRLLRQFTFMETYISTMMGQSGFLDAFQAARSDMRDN